MLLQLLLMVMFIAVGFSSPASGVTDIGNPAFRLEGASAFQSATASISVPARTNLISNGIAVTGPANATQSMRPLVMAARFMIDTNGYPVVPIPVVPAPVDELKVDDQPVTDPRPSVPVSGTQQASTTIKADDGVWYHTRHDLDNDAAREFAYSHGGTLPFLFSNPTSEGMCVHSEVGSTIKGPDGKLHPRALSPDEDKYNRMAYVAPHSILIIGNFLPTGYFEWNGVHKPKFGCDENCNCEHFKDDRVVDSQFEWTLHMDGGRWENHLWENLSNVNGLTSNIKATSYGINDTACTNGRVIDIAPGAVKALCPTDHFWEDKFGNVGCISDCKHTGSDAHCCEGVYAAVNRGKPGHIECQKSSQFNKALAPDAYAWPSDDARSVDACLISQAVHIEFSPLR